MNLLAGTSKGVFVIEQGEARQVLECQSVRNLFVSGDRIFAGTGDGVFVSEDEGRSWTLTGLMGLEVWQIEAVDSNLLYAVTQPAGLYRSADGGTTWQEVESFAKVAAAADWCVPIDPPSPGRARALVIDRNDPNYIWVGVEVGGIMRSDDGGNSWQFNLPGDNPDLHMMCAHPDNPQTLFASTGYGRIDGIAEMIEGNAGVFRSDDNGANWRYVWHGVTPRYSRPMCIDQRKPFALTVASAPTAFSHYKEDGGAQAMLYRSDDCGATWHSLCDQAHSPSADNFHGLISDPEILGGVITGTDSGELWRVSKDAEWTKVSSDMPAVLSIAAC